jgi:hypothetical protein
MWQDQRRHGERQKPCSEALPPLKQQVMNLGSKIVLYYDI